MRAQIEIETLQLLEFEDQPSVTRIIRHLPGRLKTSSLRVERVKDLTQHALVNVALGAHELFLFLSAQRCDHLVFLLVRLRLDKCAVVQAIAIFLHLLLANRIQFIKWPGVQADTDLAASTGETQ